MTMLSIAVVGGRGFIGGGIVGALRKHGHRVTIVSSNASFVEDRPGAKFGDMLRPETMRAAIDGAEVVVQSVNFPTYPFENLRKGHTYFTFDSTGTRNLAQIAKECGVRRYVFVAGVGAWLNSDKPYFRAIGEGEQAIAESGLEAVSLRPTLVYGPRDRGINAIVRFARLSPVIPLLGAGNQIHQPIFIDDLADAACQVVGSGAPAGIFEVGGPERMTLYEMIKRALWVAGIRRALLPVPVRFARFSGALLERLPGSFLTRAGIDFSNESFTANAGAAIPGIKIGTRFEQGLSTYLGTIANKAA